MSANDKNGDPEGTAIQAAQEHEEFTKPAQFEETVPMPEELRNMSDAELEALRKKMVRKLDSVIM